MIGADEYDALVSLRFNPAPTPDDVWRPSVYNVPELHERVVREIVRGVNSARTEDNGTPLGVAMQGRAGSGKTHLLGAVREKIQREGGYFFLINIISGRTFWENTAACIVEGLGRDTGVWGTQLRTFLKRLTPMLPMTASQRSAICGDAPLTRDDLDAFIDALREVNPAVGRECQDTARALVLHGSKDFEAQDVGDAHLVSELGDPAQREAWGLKSGVRPPQQVVQDISRLMALTLDPTIIAIDQVDTLFAQTSTAFFNHDEALEDAQAKVIAPIADGLLSLRDITRRTLVVMSCLPDTWELLKRAAAATVIDRFQDAFLHDRMFNAEIGEAIIAKRFGDKFAALRFSAPYPTWPIKREAFADAPSLTPRQLLRCADRHVTACLDNDELIELDRLVADGATTAPPTAGLPVPVRTVHLDDLDQRYAELLTSTNIPAALDHTTEDEVMPGLVSAGLACWIEEQAPTGTTFKHDPPPGRKPALHARLIQVLDEATENEAHWAFRAIASPNAIAVISRMKAACTVAGLDREIPQRRLIVLRNGPWPSGPRSTEVRNAFIDAGGILSPVSDGDLRVFVALQTMRATPHAQFQEWLVARRPASSTELFRSVLADAGLPLPFAEPTRRPHVVAAADTRPTAPSEDVTRSSGSEIGVGDVTSAGQTAIARAAPTIDLGSAVNDGSVFRVNLESLRRHAVIFAGSGSGKTVLIRRLVEECARQGVSSIVLDPNNDLARLGDAWPQRPVGWLPGDAERAADYLDNTDVVVWTPRVNAGRPLAFQPLPDFGPVTDSPDEFNQAIDSAVEALAPRAGVAGSTKSARHGKAVLTEALRAYARGPNTGLRGFTDFLSDLPDGVSTMSQAPKLARDAAETIKAAMVTDPLFGGEGTAADPGALLTPATGKRARVSIISLVGLASDEQRQSFVNQLQMALFNWIKRNPAGDRPLGGLFVMDEAQTLAPSNGKTPSTASSIALASQARKYGLGLVFATQAPKGLHNQISGNATTQFFGLLNAPAQIDAARELAQAKGGNLPDIGLLTSGQFYAAGDGFSFLKVKTPLCLTYHPAAPLTPEQVIERARRVEN
jgi:hypothetical protein